MQKQKHVETESCPNFIANYFWRTNLKLHRYLRDILNYSMRCNWHAIGKKIAAPFPHKIGAIAKVNKNGLLCVKVSIKLKCASGNKINDVEDLN